MDKIVLLKNLLIKDFINFKYLHPDVFWIMLTGCLLFTALTGVMTFQCKNLLSISMIILITIIFWSIFIAFAPRVFNEWPDSQDQM